MKQRVLPWLIPSIFILWLFFVLATFFVVQKPFTTVHALAAGQVFLDLSVAGWVALVGWGLGVWLLQWLLPAKEGPEISAGLTGENAEGFQTAARPSFETSVLGMGVGLGIVGLLGLAVGMLGLFRPGVIYSLTGLLSLGLLGWFWRHRPHGNLSGSQTPVWEPERLPQRPIDVTAITASIDRPKAVFAGGPDYWRDRCASL
jgi:hypothetical protein